MNTVQKSALVEQLTWLGYFLMLLLMVVTSLPAKGADGPSLLFVLCVKIIPLLIVLPGLLLKSLRAHIWLCFIVLFYFTRAVVDSFLSLGSALDLVITTVTVVLFITAMLYVKWERALGREL